MDEKILLKYQRRIDDFLSSVSDNLVYRDYIPLTVEAAITPEPVPFADRLNLDYHPVHERESWGYDWASAWFHVTAEVPEEFAGKELCLRFHVGGEALVFDENGVLIPPGEFIPLAEKNGLIDEISWLVLKKVCQFLGEHPELPLASVSINMSIQQLTDRTFLRRVHSCQAQYGVPAGKLRFEITERTVAEKPEQVNTVMAQLATEGIRFYLDDFGVGYSNLASMINLPFETVKLDSSLLQNIDENAKMYDTVRLLVQMMHNAGFIVVAEGIERLAQLECVKALGIDRVQGYYYARPMPQKELETFLTYRKLVLVKNVDAV